MFVALGLYLRMVFVACVLVCEFYIQMSFTCRVISSRCKCVILFAIYWLGVTSGSWCLLWVVAWELRVLYCPSYCCGYLGAICVILAMLFADCVV